jgi:membrane-associated protease RseP (regulator of RpoE activity)
MLLVKPISLDAATVVGYRGIFMDPTITTLLLYFAVWIGIYLVGKVLKAERFGFVLSPIYFMYKTTALNEWIDSLAEKRRGLWRTLGNVGIAVGVGLMVYAIYQLGLNLFNLFFRVEAAASIQPVIPLPGLTISWESFPYLVLAISLVAATHELAHGIAARVDNVPLKSAGVLIAVVLPSAFVEVEEEQLEKASNQTKMRIYAAGSFTNAALGLVVLLLFANFAATIAPFYTTNYAGVEVSGLIPGYPAERAGLRVGDVITGVNGTPVHAIAELQHVMSGISPGGQVTISTQRGDFQIVTEPDPKDSTRAIMGVSPIRDLITYSGRLPFLPENLPYHILRVEFWTLTAFVSVAIFNMMPLYVTDGDRFLGCLLKALGIRRTKGIRMFATSASLAIVGLNFALSILRFGFIKL